MAKKPPKARKKPKQGLSQKDKFIAYAKNVEADESGETFKRAIKVLVKKKSR